MVSLGSDQNKSALLLRSGLPSTLIRHENEAFQKLSSNRRTLKTPFSCEKGTFRKNVKNLALISFYVLCKVCMVLWKKKYGRHLVFHRDYVNVVETKPKADLEVERQMSFRKFYLLLSLVEKRFFWSH